MKGTITVGLTACLFFVSPGFAASVDYQHPNISIVAVQESLDSVLQSVGKEMKISVVLPLGLNPIINCDIENKPIDKAFKTLLGDLSYSMQWEEGGERLAGLVIMPDGMPPTGATVSEGTSNSSDGMSRHTAHTPSSSGRSEATSYGSSVIADVPGSMDHELHMTEQQERRQVEQAKQEARFREARVEQETRHREARLEEEARIREEDDEYEAKERALFANGTPDL